MKAAVLRTDGQAFRYEDVSAPTPVTSRVLLHLAAATSSTLDRERARGTHYAGSGPFTRPVIVGVAGVGRLDDGTRVHRFGQLGRMAKQALD